MQKLDIPFERITSKFGTPDQGGDFSSFREDHYCQHRSLSEIQVGELLKGTEEGVEGNEHPCDVVVGKLSEITDQPKEVSAGTKLRRAEGASEELDNFKEPGPYSLRSRVERLPRPQWYAGHPLRPPPLTPSPT